MKSKIVIGILLFLGALPLAAQEWKLVWSQEFNEEGRPDSSVWNYEQGFVRNHEAQWYQPENAYQKDGLLIIEARKEQKNNPLYFRMFDHTGKIQLSLWSFGGLRPYSNSGWSLACHLDIGQRHGMAIMWRDRPDGVLPHKGCSPYLSERGMGQRPTLSGRMEQ